MILSTTAAIILNSILYGITMKVADLLNEHGLKWFKGSNLLFGFLWGIFGSLLILSNNTIANIMLAMNVAFIIRNRLDYINHQIAASLIIMTFLYSASFEPVIFLTFYLVFLIFGSLKDYVDDKLKKKNKRLHLLSEAMLYYPIPTLILAILIQEWIVFWSFLFYTTSYDLTKIIAKKNGYK